MCMIKPIFKIVNNKLNIIGFYLHINIFLNKQSSFIKYIRTTEILPTEVCSEIISYLPDTIELILRLDIPATFPINNLYVSYHELKNKFLFPDCDFTLEIDYIKHKVKKINSKYCMVDNINFIDFDYLRANSIEYLKDQINTVHNRFNQIQCVH